MNGQAIPGFYWDPEKKKYFKIQSAAASRDQNLKYSAQNIRKNERRERVQGAAKAKATRVRKERVTRQHGNLTQTCIERESGSRRRSYYVQSLWPNACAYGISAVPKRVVEKPPGPGVRLFDRDPISKTLYVVHGDNSIKRRRHHTSTDGPPLPEVHHDEEDYYSSIPLNPYSFEPWDELQRTTSTVSSLTYLPTSGALAATTYGSDRPPVVYLSDPDRDGPYVGQQFTPKGCNTIWGAAARPDNFMPSLGARNSIAATHTEHLAVAASSSVLLFSRSQTGTWDSTTPVTSLNTDVLALDWISYSTIAFGSRDGSIRLYDTRSGGSSHILTHPHPISAIKRGDDQTRIVVSGLNSSLNLYDIRSPRVSRGSWTGTDDVKPYYHDEYSSNQNHSRRNNKRRKMKQTASNNWSQPVITFPYINAHDPELGIDVHAGLGLVAAAQDLETSTTIRISNMWTGQTVKDLTTVIPEIRSNTITKIRCLQFIDDDVGGGPSLWANCQRSIARFAW
ncbi:hypothetical protein BKA63DRAFT_416454 [Paraphoma chrysanthemicola]|nr:hypothetical protein BKA63DRAFT_416454 [Paraphoma chrysanthemicola]